MKKLLNRSSVRWIALAALPMVAALSFFAVSQGSPPVIPLIALATEPLYAASTSDKPTLALALSVEFPTVGTQYRDGTYSNTKEFIGYYDAEACYIYNNNPSETPIAPLTAQDYKRFDRAGAATNRMCDAHANSFSGNYLNWASSSAIDMLRLALSGGDRYIDTPTQTILQRAVLPDGDPSCFWNNRSYFPAKNLTSNGGNYFGAIPQSMRTSAAGNTVTVANTLNRIYFKVGGTAGKCGDNAAYTLAGTTEGFFYSRVSVCTKDASGALLDVRDYNLCDRYPNGSYKPTGVIQKYSDQMRLAAFGYLMDQTASASGGRYGGVLRAPMKYVGAKTFNISGADAGTINPKSEWDASTGVFALNPEGDSEFGRSGVINYLNKFGRTGPTPGRYKQYDPVGELYYETLRYLQGLPPSPAAVSGITTTMKDGYPVYTDWSDTTGVGDPYGGGRTNTADYSCQKNNIVLIGDVNSWNGGRSKFPAADMTKNYPDLDFWNSIVVGFERNSSLSYTDGQGTPRLTTNPNTANPNPRGGNFDLVTGQRRLFTGYAYWAHTQDIRGTSWTDQPTKQRPGLRTKSFFFDVNENSSESDANNRHYGNPFFTAAKYGGFESDPANLGAKPYNTFGNPFQQQDGTVNNNVWQKPTEPGEASTYYLQSNARGVLTAFDEIFKRAGSSARSIAGSAVQSKNLREATANAIYQGTFDTSDWSGDLMSIPVSVSAANAVTISPTNNWTAAEKLGALVSPETTRNIVVGRPGATATPTARNFTWGTIDTDLQAHLDKAAPGDTPDGLGEARLDYLRGKRAMEGTTFRLRNKLLGDIINSAVVYSGKPGLNSSTSGYSSYSTFVSTVNALNSGNGRVPAVFVGANDGMLHAFEATVGQTTSGKELFGYIPSWMGPKLSALTKSSYINNHQAYVDGPPTVADALVGQSPDIWKTVLVSGTGAGGRGVFALDVTNPAAFDASKVMWEFTQVDDPSMGYVIGRPQIVKIRTNATGSAPIYRWFAAVPSGVNNYQDDGAGNFSTTGAPTLFLLALDKAAGTAWTATGANPNYYKISLPVTTTATATGLANFSTALGKAGEAAQMYMGDLHGNLWKLDFELASNGTADWTVDLLSPFKKGTAAYPLYIARDGTASQNRQPITMAPSLIRGENNKSTYVAFGTGKYLELADKSSVRKQSVYAVFDSDEDATADSTSPARESVINGRDRLKAGTVSTVLGTVSVDMFTWGRPLMTADLATTSERAGWYFDFPYTGERQVSNAKSIGDYLVFSSLIPGASGVAGTCSAGGGGGGEYTINIDTGDGKFRLSTVGILGEPLIMEIPGATIYSPADNTGRRKKTVISQTIQQGAEGLSATTPVTTEFVAGRLSWRQINNYQDRKLAP